MPSFVNLRMSILETAICLLVKLRFDVIGRASAESVQRRHTSSQRPYGSETKTSGCCYTRAVRTYKHILIVAPIECLRLNPIMALLAHVLSNARGQ